MSIETICKGCAAKLRVGNEYAGRKARCPHCKTIYTVPGVEHVDGISDTGESWLLRVKDGTLYGPVTKSDLDGWVQEGRLDSASQIRRESETEWRQATEVYASLLPANSSSESPFAGQPTITRTEENPYASPSTADRISRGYRPHRGGMILTLGILGFACCQLFSVAAWVMGHADMKEIKAGRMDPEGRGLTQAGMIIGIIGTVLMILITGLQILFAAFAVFSEM